MSAQELIKNCRREKDIESYKNLLKLDFSSLDSRWLISICDTIVDMDEDEKSRSNALLLSVFLNTLKLWATSDLLYKGELNFKKYSQLKIRSETLWDGMMAFRPVSPRGDVTWNMFRRMVRELKKTPVVYNIYSILINRLKNTKNPLTELDKLHGEIFKNS